MLSISPFRAVCFAINIMAQNEISREKTTKMKKKRKKIIFCGIEQGNRGRTALSPASAAAGKRRRRPKNGPRRRVRRRLFRRRTGENPDFRLIPASQTPETCPTGGQPEDGSGEDEARDEIVQPQSEAGASRRQPRTRAPFSIAC